MPSAKFNLGSLGEIEASFLGISLPSEYIVSSIVVDLD